MFTGIIEHLGKVEEIVAENTNLHFKISSPIAQELKVDQSIAHNGVCLTVTEVISGAHWVTAIDETLKKTTLSTWKIGSIINLERCVPVNGRLDGHIVQGHVDRVVECKKVEDQQGSWLYTFSIPKEISKYFVDKGSVCINGISLTVVEATEETFSVAIIPYTYEHTNMKTLIAGSLVNIEFDIIGKYVLRMISKE